jgi:L-aspartate oxidase
MWDKCGVLRSGDALREACAWLEQHEAGNEVALLIARCALAREESRGAHYRGDFPEKSAAFERHSVVSRNSAVRFR